MKKTPFLILFCVLLFYSLILHAQTEVSGDVSGVWEASGSPYLVTDSIWVNSGDSLIIEPGCSVIFQGHFPLVIDTEAVLIAIGTETDSIVFTATDTNLTESSGGWGAIRFINSDDGCELAYCLLEYGNKFHPDYIHDWINADGGAIYCLRSSPYIHDNTFTNNKVRRSGGAICLESSNPTITRNWIYNNKALSLYGDGGGIACIYSSPLIEDNIIEYNYGRESAGAIYAYAGSSPQILNNQINNNCTDWDRGSGGAIVVSQAYSRPIIRGNVIAYDTSYYGGAIIVGSTIGCNPEISNNIFIGNYSFYVGGALHLTKYIEITNNIFVSNHADELGGAVYSVQGVKIEGCIVAHNHCNGDGGGLYLGGDPVYLENNVIFRNTANGNGGGIYKSNYARHIVVNNTIAYNSALGSGNGVYCYGASKFISFGNIFWQNDSINSNDIHSEGHYWPLDGFWDYPDIFVSSTNIDSDGLTGHLSTLILGEHNIYENPCFIDTLFHLSEYSPCIDAGTDHVLTPWWDTLWAPTEDIEGNSRPLGEAWDIGAYEYDPTFISEIFNTLPEKLELMAYPNPFNSSVTIYIDATNLHFQNENTEVNIYNIQGKKVADLSNQLTNKQINDKHKSPAGEVKPSGNYTLTWKPENLPSGIYIVNLQSPSITLSHKILYLK